MLEQAEEELARIKKERVRRLKKVFTFAVVGPPVQKLVEYAKEQAIDLIMVATHGRTGGEHLLHRQRHREAVAQRAVLGPGLTGRERRQG